MQAWGLIVLLISKAAGHLNVDEMEEDKAAGVLHSQRALAEVTEMIRTSHLVHNGLVNIYPGLYPEPAILNDMAFGNKIALLSGDYLLSNSCAELASLRNQDVSNKKTFGFKFYNINLLNYQDKNIFLNFDFLLIFIFFVCIACPINQ